MELEEGEINELEDGEIEDDETSEERPVNPTKQDQPTPAFHGSEYPSRFPNTLNFRGGKTQHFNPPSIPWQSRDVVVSPRYIDNIARGRGRESPRIINHFRVRPSFHSQNHGGPSPRQHTLSWNRGLPRTSPLPLIQPIPPLMETRSKPYVPQLQPTRLPSPHSPEISHNIDDFDLLLERHKQIQLQLENLEKEESANLYEVEEIFDDSFVDIPVDSTSNRGEFPGSRGKHLEQRNSAAGSSGLNNEESSDNNLPKIFEPFKIKSLYPPVPTLKQLSNQQKEDSDSNQDLVKSLESVQINSEPSLSEKALQNTVQRSNPFCSFQNNPLAVKKKRRRVRRKRQKDSNKAIPILNKMNINVSPGSSIAKLGDPSSEIESRLMLLASSGRTMNTADLVNKMRSNTEQQKKRRERVKQWHQSRTLNTKFETLGKGRGQERHSLLGARVMQGSTNFEQDDYLEAPMDVESDTPDGPVLPLIDEAGDDLPPPPPPPPLPTNDQELMNLHTLQQQQMSYANYSGNHLVNQVHVSPNIHGFYPPGQIIYSDWPSSYQSSVRKESGAQENTILSYADNEGSQTPLQETAKEDQLTPTPVESDEEDDDEAALLREILLKSVAKKRAAKDTIRKNVKSLSAPASPGPAAHEHSSTTKTTTIRKNPVKQQTKSIRKVQAMPLMPPQHVPLIIQLGQDTDDSDLSEEEASRPKMKERGGFFGSLDMMIKQARESVVNSKPKQDSKSAGETERLTVPKTPDALEHLPEERRAEYRRLKEQLAQHEVKKRQPLSDISQDKEVKPEGDSIEESVDSNEDGGELLELKEKAKGYEDKLTKHRKILSQDQGRLSKMTSVLSEKTSLLEGQELKVSLLRKRLEVEQKAMLNNRLVIKKLHERAMTVKERISRKMIVNRNLEEELLRVKSLVSAKRKDPGFFTGSQSNENRDSIQEPVVRNQQRKPTGPRNANQAEGLKRSTDDADNMTVKKAKLDTPKTQSAKASPSKQIVAERIAQEKARLKCLEQELAERLSHYNKSPNKLTAARKEHNWVENTAKLIKPKVPASLSVQMDTTSSTMKECPVLELAECDGNDAGAAIVISDDTEKENKSALNLSIDLKQLEYVKTLQAEKEKQGPPFHGLSIEIPQPIHKRTAMCIWLESDKKPTPVVDVDPENMAWFGTSGRKITENTEDELENERNLPEGLYESVLLYYRSYRLSPYFRTKAGMSLSSLSYTHKLNVSTPLCNYDLNGSCNDEDCKYQHKGDYTPTGDDGMRDIASYLISEKENVSPTTAVERIGSFVDNFTKQYKDKIPLDQLYVLLVNRVKNERKNSVPFNVCGVRNTVSIKQQHKKAAVAAVSAPVDDGRGVQFVKKTGQKKRVQDNVPPMECQEVRYFAEVYNSIKNLTDAVEESPTDIALWTKLAQLQLGQKADNMDGEDQQNMSLMQSLSTLSRGLEANPNSEDLWLEYLKLFNIQGNSEEHKELCEQAIGFVPSYDIWWHYLNSINNYNDKRAICLKLINQLAKEEQDNIDELHSHRLLESLLYLIQLELYTGRFRVAVSTFQSAVGKKKINPVEGVPRLSSLLSAPDLCLAWLAYIHVFEFHRLPTTWFDPKCGYPSKIVVKEAVVFPWQPSGGTRASSEKLLGMFHEALRACTFRSNKSTSKISLCIPLYQNLLALERAHGRLDSAKGICRRLLQSTPSQVELWQCLAALEGSTGNPSQALVVLDDALNKCSYDCELAYTAARLYLEQGNPSKAIDTLVCSISSKYLKPHSSKESPVSQSECSQLDPVVLYRRLLSQPLPYDTKTPELMSGIQAKPAGKEELHLWLSYCLLLELSPSISTLCLQYNLTAESAYETAVHSITNTKNSQAVWLEYLFYKKSRVVQSNPGSAVDSLRSLDDLVNRCLVSATVSRSMPYSTSESWQDYSFHNQVINLYLGCLPQTLWSAVYTKYLKSFPANVNLVIRACEHEASLGRADQAIKVAANLLAEHPWCITLWKIIISLNLQRNHTKKALKLYQQSTELLPFAATLWKDFLMFKMVHSEDQSSLEDIVKQCNKVGVDVQDYMNTLLGK